MLRGEGGRPLDGDVNSSRRCGEGTANSGRRDLYKRKMSSDHPMEVLLVMSCHSNIATMMMAATLEGKMYHHGERKDACKTLSLCHTHLEKISAILGEIALLQLYPTLNSSYTS